ncbi:MAG TPA: hypothetical protein VJZ74_08570 [Pseudolabrys sp.]|nr:hypothetical protein [Pseudolabrys sp.]
MDMVRRTPLTVLLALAAIVAALPTHAQSDDERYTIMRPEKAVRPEPWLAPKYRSPRGTREHVVIPQPQPAPPTRRQVPPLLYVPQTGRTLPNLPAPGSGGRETAQDRAARCAHQAGVYGQAAGDRNAYVGSCVNQ